MDYEAGASVSVRMACVVVVGIAIAVGIAEISRTRFFVVQCRKPIVAAIIFIKIKGYAVAPCLEIFKRIVAEHLFFADKPATFGGDSRAIHCP